jgi:hypothetical protein
VISAALLGHRAILALPQTRCARLDHVLAPATKQRLGQVVLAADLRDRPSTAERGEHWLDLLLRRELSVLALSLKDGLPSR